MSMQYTLDEQDEFLDKIDNVQKQIDDIISGKVDIHELDRQEEAQKEKERLKQVAQEIKEREWKEQQRRGRPGKGHQGKYLTYCKACSREFFVEGVDKCPFCDRDTITQEERMEELRGKLEEFKQAKVKKMTRKAKWDNWKKTQEMFYKKTSTNYYKWDMFESDEEEEPETEPIVPKDDPQFKAMEKDIEERGRKRRADKKKAAELKELGNAALKKCLYKTARKHYSEAVETQRDLLPGYTNRALCYIKLEQWQECIDDCTRVLDYCEVFDEGYDKKPDLAYKAAIRRAQAHRGRNDFEEAFKDLKLAEEILPEEKDPAKLRALYLEDEEHEKRISKIMENAESLKGKEFIDFLLDYLQGKTHTPEIKPGQKSLPPKKCPNELKQEECDKLLKTLEENEELIYYFNTKDGFKTLVDSLYHDTRALAILDAMLTKRDKLREDFQRQHQYEALIDFLYKRNVKAEGATLDNDSVYSILLLLENGSLNEVVRGTLSEMAKIKDLFLIVIRSIDIKANRKLVSSLIQFVSNLCYGTGKFRRMLSNEQPQEFLGSLEEILASVQDVQKGEENQTMWDAEKDRVTLKHTSLGLVGNLCVEPKLRVNVAADMGKILSRVICMFENDVNNLPFDWIDSSSRELAVLINSGLEERAQIFMADKNIVPLLDQCVKQLLVSKQSGIKDVIARCVNVLSKVSKNPKGLKDLVGSKTLIMNILLGYTSDVEDLFKSSLIAMHQCCKVPNFREICFEEHKFAEGTFNTFVKCSLAKFNKIVEEKAWDQFTHICHSISGFTTAFPERTGQYKDIIKPLIEIIADKTDAVRRAAAVLLAHLSKDNEDNKKEMTKYHGSEVLMSLRDVFLNQNAVAKK